MARNPRAFRSSLSVRVNRGTRFPLFAEETTRIGVAFPQESARAGKDETANRPPNPQRRFGA
jgi:hypothetical protein